MPIQFPLEIEAGQTYKLTLYFLGVSLAGCQVTTQIRRTRAAADVDHEFTSTPAAGWSIGQTGAAVVLEDGRTVAAGTWFAELRIEKSVTASMSGSYWYATEVEFPEGVHPEPDCEQPIHGPVSVLPETVR
jgi:hypothetical protein